jgi:hypothetical protein
MLSFYFYFLLQFRRLKMRSKKGEEGRCLREGEGVKGRKE